MNLIKLNTILKAEPDYREKQIKKAILRDLIEDWSKATILPLVLREKLKENCPIGISGKIFVSKRKDIIKSLITLKDGLRIETVLMRHKDNRNTVCVSSQVGCPLGCLFCATGKMGFKRNLNYFEIVEQVLFFARLLKKEKQKITNIVFMGMGEPFLNYKNVITAIKTLNDKDGFNLGARSFSISTAGIVEGIKKLVKENLQINLAISLHAPDNKLRFKIMPVNKKYPIEEILKAVDEYIKKTKRRVMFEYLMIKDLNDSDASAKRLAALLKNKSLIFVNLISYNPTGVFQPSPPQRIKKFKEVLEKEGVSVTQRYSFPQEIKAGCGQLTTKDF